VSARPPEHYLHGFENGNLGVILLTAENVARLSRCLDLDHLRPAVRGGDAIVDSILVAFRLAELAWRSSATGITPATKAEPRSVWMTATEVAEGLNVSTRRVRAITPKHLHGIKDGGRWRYRRDDYELYRSTRKRRHE
jgi:hypothetical protein